MSSGGNKPSSFYSSSNNNSSNFVPAPRSGGGSSGFRNVTHGAWERKGNPVLAMRKGRGGGGRSGVPNKESPSSTIALSSTSSVPGSNNKFHSSATPKIGADVKSPRYAVQQGPTPLLPGSDAYVMACRDRFIGVAKSLVGEYVTLSMRNGTIHEGVLHTCTPFRNEPFSILLKHVKTKKSPNSVVEVETTLEINATDMVELHAPHFPNVLQSTHYHPSGFATDTDISGVTLGGKSRKLEKVDSSWVTPPSTGSSKHLGSLGSSSSTTTNGKKWDQFEANEKLYGVKASFDENLYTTELDKKFLTWNQQYRAEMLAREIESKESYNPHIREERNQGFDKDMSGERNEEMRYSGVQRTTTNTRLLGSPRAAASNNSSTRSSPSPTCDDGRISSSTTTSLIRGGSKSGHASPSSPTYNNGSQHHTRITTITTTSPRGPSSPSFSVGGGSSNSEKVYRPPALRNKKQSSNSPTATAAPTTTAMPPVVVGGANTTTISSSTTRNAEYEAQHQLQQVLDGKLSSRVGGASSSSPPPSPHDPENMVNTTTSEMSGVPTAMMTTRDSEGKKNIETVASAAGAEVLPQPVGKPAGRGEGEKKSEMSTLPERTTPSPMLDREEGSDSNNASASKKLINKKQNNTTEAKEDDDKGIQQQQLPLSSSQGTREESSSTSTSSIPKKSGSSLNPNAKDFKMNPAAKSFTPRHIGGGGEERSVHVGEVRAATVPVTDGILTTPQPMVMPVSAVTMVYPQGIYPSQQPMVFQQGRQQMQVAPVVSMGHHVPYDVNNQVPLIQGYGGGYVMGYSPQGGGIPTQGAMGRGGGGTAAAISMPLEGSGMSPGGTSFHPPSPMQHGMGVSIMPYSAVQDRSGSNFNSSTQYQYGGRGVHHYQANQS